MEHYNPEKERQWQQPMFSGISEIMLSKFVEQDRKFEEILARAGDLFKEKNRKYNNAISRTGVLGASVEFVGISARLEALVIQRHSNIINKIDEKDVRNALMDAIVYGTIGIMMLDDKNWDGER